MVVGGKFQLSYSYGYCLYHFFITELALMCLFPGKIRVNAHSAVSAQSIPEEYTFLIPLS